MTEHQKKALSLIKNIGIRERMPISDLAPNNPDYFTKLVKELIDMGYKEYEFSDCYNFVKRLDMCTFGILEFDKWRK